MWCNNTNKYNCRSLAHLCWKEHSPSIYYMDTTTDHFTPLALRVRGNDSFGKGFREL